VAGVARAPTRDPTITWRVSHRIDEMRCFRAAVPVDPLTFAPRRRIMR